MAETSQLIATFILNAIWQITAITALALLCTKLLHRAPSRFSHGVWIRSTRRVSANTDCDRRAPAPRSHGPHVRGYPNCSADPGR